MSTTSSNPPTAAAAATSSSGGAGNVPPAGDVPASAPAPGVSHAWEAVESSQHTWSTVQEDEHGNLIVGDGTSLSLADLVKRRRKRQERNDYSQRNRRVVRDMIRYLYVVIDASRWTRQKDPVLPPGTRLDVTCQLLQHFVQEYYDQNPLSHLGFVVCQNGEAEIVAPLSGSGSKSHVLSLKGIAELALSQGQTAGGEFSLQNGLEVAGRSLGHQPRHGSREIVLITSALTTCDPGNVLTETLPKLLRSSIRFSCFALTAELHVCRKIADATNGHLGVCLDKQHFRDWMFGQCVPPPSTSRHDEGDDGQHQLYCEMIPMGFPTRTTSTGKVPGLVHATRSTTILARTSYVCPQCQAKNASLPSDCAVCGLKLVLAPHLARSFHHLFPVPTFLERSTVENSKNDDGPRTTASSSSSAAVVSGPVVSSSNPAAASTSELDSKLLVTSFEDDPTCCRACLKPLVVRGITSTTSANPNAAATATQQLLRFQCPDCSNYFCVDCDAYLHETLHNCPGCLCLY